MPQEHPGQELYSQGKALPPQTPEENFRMWLAAGPRGEMLLVMLVGV